jgi:hypothetical protein
MSGRRPAARIRGPYPCLEEKREAPVAGNYSHLGSLTRKAVPLGTAFAVYAKSVRYIDPPPPAIEGIIESVSFADTSERSFSGI